MTIETSAATPTRILIVGGGYVGINTAMELRKYQRRAGEQDRRLELTLVNPDNFMLFRPLLPEVASGTAEARHAVVPLREALTGIDIVSGKLTHIDLDQRRAQLVTLDNGTTERTFDHLVVAVGALTRLLPIDGLAEHGIGFTTVAEALFLRNHVLARLEAAHATPDPQRRQRALTFVVVGGGYSGVEALAELQDLARDACRWYPNIAPDDMRWILVEATDRLLPSLPRSLEQRASEALAARGVDIRLETLLDHADEGSVTLSEGTTLPTDTLVWAAGVTPNPLARDLGLPVDDKGRLPVDSALRVEGVSGVWAAGDCAAVPDLVTGGTCPPTAQYAVRQGRALAHNIVATLENRPMTPFRYRSKGMFVTLGKRRGVASVGPLRLRGMLAWALRRGYYSATIPTVKRKSRTVADWLVALPSHHDSSDMGTEHEPLAPFEQAAASARNSGSDG